MTTARRQPANGTFLATQFLIMGLGFQATGSSSASLSSPASANG